jgi:RNA polymerase sigma-70 factor (ECF subfamily)
MKRVRCGRHARVMNQLACASPCAELCTDQGLADAHAIYHLRLLARARQVVVDPGLAEEAVQEAFLRAWQFCSTFNPAGGPVLHWLLAITRNAAIDMARARGRRPPLAPAEAGRDRAAAGLSDADLVVLRTQLRDALTGIGIENRRAIVETILRDRPSAEVAAELGVSAGTIRTRVHYGLRQLRGLLETVDAA